MVQWYLGIPFTDAMQKIAEYLGVDPIGKARGRAGGRSTPPWKPGLSKPAPTIRQVDTVMQAENLERVVSELTPLPWNELAASQWCSKKTGIQTQGLLSMGAYQARYRKWTVIVVPINDQASQKSGAMLYRLNGGPLYGKKGTDGRFEELKIKLVGSGSGTAACKTQNNHYASLSAART